MTDFDPRYYIVIPFHSAEDGAGYLNGSGRFPAGARLLKANELTIELEGGEMLLKKLTVYEACMIVEGAGDFPIDMLRYDSAVPWNEANAGKMQSMWTEAGRDPRKRIALHRFAPRKTIDGNGARWQSFGWRLLWVGSIEELPNEFRAVIYPETK